MVERGMSGCRSSGGREGEEGKGRSDGREGEGSEEQGR